MNARSSGDSSDTDSTHLAITLPLKLKYLRAAQDEMCWRRRPFQKPTSDDVIIIIIEFLSAGGDNNVNNLHFNIIAAVTEEHHISSRGVITGGWQTTNWNCYL